MMIFPNCPEHGRLILDLALGRLDDDAAAEADRISETCPVCRAWWREQFEGSAAEVVDEAVAASFDDLELPSRRRGHGWMAVAAAAVMALGVGSLWVARAPVSVEPAVVDRTASIQRLDFEVPEAVAELVGTEALDLETAAEPVEQPTIEISTPGEIVVAEKTPTETLIDADAGRLFAGGFESGDLGAWVPKT